MPGDDSCHSRTVAPCSEIGIPSTKRTSRKPDTKLIPWEVGPSIQGKPERQQRL